MSTFFFTNMLDMVLHYTRVLGFVSYFQYVKTKLCAMIGVFATQCRPLEMMKSSETLK